MNVADILRAKKELEKARLRCACGAAATQILVGPDSVIGVCDEHIADVLDVDEYGEPRHD